jgi:hypothetical protein
MVEAPKPARAERCLGMGDSNGAFVAAHELPVAVAAGRRIEAQARIIVMRRCLQP